MNGKGIKYLLTILAILLLCASPAEAQEKRDSVVVSLITCWPGSEIYELCGHEAVRVRGTVDGHQLDSVWNYGVFSFNEPNFVYRFVKGETDYMLAGYPFAWFLPEYVSSGRKVLEQDINFTQPEAMKMLGLLREEAKPENRRYRYNYVRDNCATRILVRMDSASSSRIIYPDSLSHGTFRRAMRHYHRNYPWYQFGIDLALGGGLDRRITGRDEMFAPVDMSEKAAGAHFEDGRTLISRWRVLNEGGPDATLGPTSVWLTPLAVSIYLLLAGAGMCAWMIKRKRPVKWVYSLWFGICGLAGSLIAFLVFCSEHEATSPNLLLIWLNPLQFVPAVAVWFRRLRPAVVGMAFYNIFALLCLLAIWPFQIQSANPAFFPLMVLTLGLAVTYVALPASEPNGKGVKKSVSRKPSAAYGRNAKTRKTK